MTRKHQGELWRYTLDAIHHHSPYDWLAYRENHTRDDLTVIQRTHNQDCVPLNARRLYRPVVTQTISVWGIHRHSNRHTPQGSASCVQSFDDSLIVQFALRIAFRCVLHRCRNLDIRCWNCLVIDYWIIMSWLTDFWQSSLVNGFGLSSMTSKAPKDFYIAKEA